MEYGETDARSTVTVHRDRRLSRARLSVFLSSPNCIEARTHRPEPFGSRSVLLSISRTCGCALSSAPLGLRPGARDVASSTFLILPWCACMLDFPRLYPAFSCASTRFCIFFRLSGWTLVCPSSTSPSACWLAATTVRRPAAAAPPCCCCAEVRLVCRSFSEPGRAWQDRSGCMIGCRGS